MKHPIKVISNNSCCQDTTTHHLLISAYSGATQSWGDSELDCRKFNTSDATSSFDIYPHCYTMWIEMCALENEQCKYFECTKKTREVFVVLCFDVGAVWV